MDTLLNFIYFLILYFVTYLKSLFLKKKQTFYKKPKVNVLDQEVVKHRAYNKKPDWVKQEVLYLKAVLPDYVPHLRFNDRGIGI